MQSLPGAKKTQSRLSLRYIDEDLAISDTHAWTYLRVPVVPYEFIGYDDRKAIAERIYLALAALVTGNTPIDAHLVITSRPFDSEDWAEKLNERTTNWGPTSGWENYLNRMKNHLEEAEYLNKEVYLGINLGPRKASIKTQGLDLLGPVKKLINFTENTLDLEDFAISQTELEDFRHKAKEVQRSLGQSQIQAVPAHPNSVAWLTMKPLYPNMVTPPPTSVDRKVWGPGEIQALGEGFIENNRRHLAITQVDWETGQEVTGYTATVCFSRFPDVLSFPDQEPWMHFASALAFPTELSSRFTLVPAIKVQKDVGRKLMEVKDQAHHIGETGSSIPLEIMENYGRATELEYLISRDRQPWVYGRHRLRVTGATLEELTGHVKKTIEHYRDLGIDAVWPSGDQLNLLCEAMPADKVRSKSYFQRQELHLIGGGMPTASAEVGDRVYKGQGWTGPAIGETTSRVRTIVNFSPHVAMARNSPPGVAITGAPGGGKALDVATPIVTPQGWTTMGDLSVGDQLFDETGKVCQVTAVYDQPKNRPTNLITFDDGSTIVADDDHLWLTETRASRQSNLKNQKIYQRKISAAKKMIVEKYLADNDADTVVTLKSLPKIIQGGPSETVYYAAAEQLRLNGYKPYIQWRGNHSTTFYRLGTILEAVITRLNKPLNDQQHKRELPSIKTTSEIRASLRTGNDQRINHSIPVTKPLQTEEKELPIDPYLLGLWLSDGTSCRADITTADQEIVWAFEDRGYTLTARKGTEHHNAPTYQIKGNFKQLLRENDLLNNKHIPDLYMRASEQQRRDLLAGLIDGDGTIAIDGQTQFCVTNQPLAQKYLELSLTLGLKATIRQRQAVMTLPDKTRKDCGLAWVVTFTSPEKLSYLHRKAIRIKTEASPVTSRRYITNIEPIESVPMRCISVDSHSRLFLAGKQMIPTHNSFLAFTLAYQMAVQGVWTIYIDPKADAKPLALLPGLGKAKVFDLKDGNDGMLDPFSLADSIPEAKLLALETVSLLLGRHMSEDRENVLNRALETVSLEPQPSLLRVVEVLLATEELAAQNLGALLRTMKDLPFARLCFSKPTGLKIRPEDGLTVITLLGLDLPTADQEPEHYSYPNRLAVAVMYLLSTFARRLMLSLDKDHPKAICIDEAWAITSTPQGAKLIPEIARMGRSHNTALVLVTQNAGDLMKESITNSISTVFGFRSTIKEEINNVLGLLNAEVHDGHRSTVRELYNGECLMKDVDGRIARVQIDSWNRDLFTAFDTNPETRGKPTGQET